MVRASFMASRQHTILKGIKKGRSAEFNVTTLFQWNLDEMQEVMVRIDVTKNCTPE
jgi:hypothetical protein